MKHFNYFLILFFLGMPCVVNAEIHLPWKMEGVNERIKKIRVGPTKLHFVNTDGSPINQRLPVKINLNKHEFQFGVGMGQSWALYGEKKFEQYRNYMGEVFNLVTLGFQWSWIEKKKGKVNKITYIEDNLEWAKDRDINIKGTPLLWHNAIPRWMDASAEAEEIEPLISKRIQYLLNKYPEIKTWNLYNEAVGAEKKYVKNNPIANWLKSKGGPAAAQAWVSQIAHQTASNRIYVNNHYSHRDPEFKKMNHELLRLGAQFDAIGIQTHMHTKKSRLSQSELWKLLEDYKVFGKPIHLTEISVPSSPPFNSWRDFQPHVESFKNASSKKNRLKIARKSDKKLEIYQAEYLRDFYTLAFSHPKVETLIYWSGSDLYEWRGTAAGLLDVKHDPKPAYRVLRDLIKKKWHTNVNDFTDETGTISFSGFYGEYSGKVILNGIEQSFSFDHTLGMVAPHIIKLSY
jgi:endo-1,4-beta-xylanase